MRIVIISDTHCQVGEDFIDNLPEGDVLVHCGDWGMSGYLVELIQHIKLMSKVRSRYSDVVQIAGNHDWIAQTARPLVKDMFAQKGIVYLDQEFALIDDLKFYGAPCTPAFGPWAFQLRLEDEDSYWSLIPDDTDVLVTHGPAWATLDCIGGELHVGDEGLRDRTLQLKNLKLHCFGHIHDSYGQSESLGFKSVNAAICNEDYKAVNKPIVIDI